MKGWFSWVVLAASAVVTQSVPRPDEYQIPAIPFGRRAQYYVLHDNGDFKYGHDTGVGAYESAVKMGSGDLTGFFGFNNALGENVRVDYTAGAGGFQPRGDHLPVAPQDPAVTGPSGSAAYRSRAHSAPTAQFSAGGASSVAQSYSASGAQSQGRPTEEANIRAHNNVDGSYSFSYDNSDSSRRESGDSDNNVVGQFSFVADDGQNRQIRYRAGSATGFVAEGDGIPEAPAVPSFLSAGSPAAAEPNVASVRQGYSYSAPDQPAFSTLYSAPDNSLSTQDQPRGDASYSFSYKTDDSARDESADPDLNVKGSFSFVGDDGQSRRVDYVAGSGTGFVARGDHLPVAPEVSDSTSSFGQTQYSAPARSSSIASTRSQSQSSRSQSSLGSRDASYQFNYQTGDSSRSESADADLNVRGDFSFVADDGQRRTVKYVAGSGTGFVAEGSHLPVAPEVPVVPAGAAAPVVSQATVHQAPKPQLDSFGSVPSQVSGAGTYSASADEPRRDASYSFNYQTGDSSRSETADSDLNVQGEYSFTGDDGQVRSVKYRAGSGTGFVAEGDHLPADVPIPPEFSTASQYSGASNVVSQQSSQQAGYAAHGSFFQSSGSGQQAGANIASTRNTDGSYSFSYQNADSSRSESADANNNVVGEYSFVADDGENRRIRYQAGSGTGFVADGSSIPTSPDFRATSQSSSTFTAPQVPTRSKFGTAPAAVPYSAASSTGSQGRGDASYSFNYNTGDSSRNEEADSDLNVRGSYSFVADDGVNRQVNYVAGSGTGFVADGDHLPVSPAAPVAGGATASQVLVKSAPSVPATFGSSYGSTSSNQEIANVRSNLGADGGYSFSYTNSDSSRSETGDADNNVVGQFSFVADDGQNRQVRYRAGAATGFVAEGDGIPEVPEIAATSSLGRADPVAPKVQGYTYSAPSVQSSGASSGSAVVRTGSTFGQTGETRGDASYSFKYDAGDSAREENADSDLNVRGQYSFVADDGVRRNVNYRAGSATGFVAEGDHLPVAPKVSSAGQVASTRTSAGYSSSIASTRSGSGAGVRSSSTLNGPDGLVIGNVLLRQYPVTAAKAGYVFTEI